MKLTTARLKRLIKEEIEKMDEAIPNPSQEQPKARVFLRNGKFSHIHFMGMGPNKKAEFDIRVNQLSPKAATKLTDMKGKGMTIGDVPGLASYLSSFVKNIGEDEIASAKVV